MDVQNKIYAIFAKEFTEEKKSKKVKTKIQIVEAAIDFLSTSSFEKLSYAGVAEKANVSKQLVHTYYSVKDDLFFMVFVYIRSVYQAYVLKKVEANAADEGLFKAYIRSALSWVHDMNSHSTVWPLIWYFSARDSRFMKLCVELEEIGQSRISAIIGQDLKTRDLVCANADKAAQNIQRYLTGSIIKLGTKNSLTEDYVSEVYEHCLLCIK